MTTTLDALKAMLQTDYELDPAQIHSESTLTSLGLDSLALAELLFDVEDRFHISMSSDLPQLETVGEVAGYIDSIIDTQASEKSKMPDPQTSVEYGTVLTDP